MKRLLLSFVLSSTACLPSAARAADLLMENTSFQRCEAEAFIALIIARNGMHLKDTRESLLAVKSNGDFQIKAINELFDEMAATGSKDHGGFAARKFYECATRLDLGLKEDRPAASVCLARQDIVFFVGIDHGKSVPQAEALARIKNFLSKSSKEVYPEALIDELVPMVYRVDSHDGDYQLRQMVFESCLFPQDWRAWYQEVQSRRK